MLHCHIPDLVINMVLLGCVNVLNIHLTVHKGWNRPYKMLAGTENVHHRDTVIVKGKAVMKLHLPRNSCVVCLFKIYPLSLHHSGYAFSSALVKDRWVGNAVNILAPQVYVLVFHGFYSFSNFARFPPYPFVWCACTSVKLGKKPFCWLKLIIK